MQRGTSTEQLYYIISNANMVLTDSKFKLIDIISYDYKKTKY